MGRSRFLNKTVRIPIISIFFLLLLWGNGSAVDLRNQVLVESVEGSKLGFPCDVSSDDRGFFYVLDSLMKSVVIINADGTFTKYVELDKKSIDKPEGIDVRFPGVFVIADSGNNSIIEFDVSGKKAAEWKVPGAERLVDVAVYGKRMFALDGLQGKVYVIENEISEISSFGGPGDHPGEFKSPYRIFIDQSGKILVSDVLNARIQVLDTQGKSLAEIKNFGLAHDKFLRPGGVSGDGYRHVYFTDMVSGYIFSYDTNKKSFEVLKNAGNPITFQDPVSISISGVHLGVVDQIGRKFYIFTLFQ